MVKYLIIMLLILLSIVSCKEEDSDKDLTRIFDAVTDIEPNDNIGEANEAVIIEPIVGFFNKKDGNKSDIDCYKIFLKNSIPYELVSTGVPSVDYRITILNKKNARIFSINESGKGEGERLWNFNSTDEYIFLRIESINGFNEKIPYIINIVQKEESDSEEIEPNNNESSANIININDTKRGFITPRGDIDYYKIDFDSERAYDFNIEVESLSNLDASFTIIDKKNGITKNINNFSFGGSELFNYLDSSKGDYYIRVTGEENSSVKLEPIYFISVNESKKTQNTYYEREFNDTFSLSTELISGSEMVGFFYPENDVDFYKFELYRDAISVNISLSSIKGIDSTIELFDTNHNLIKKINDNGFDYGEELILNDLKASHYYVKLSVNGRSSSSYNLYLLTRY
jgi:hypothetical protein